MRRFIAILLFASAGVAHAQNSPPDTRAQLRAGGRADKLSASPDGRLWLGAGSGSVICADSLENWHTRRVEPELDSQRRAASSFERVSFFNRDTAIVTGYIYARGTNETNAYWRTTDGGIHWTQHLFAGEGEWIYDVYIGHDGRCWMGGSSGKIHYTADAGATWTQRPTPFGREKRMAAIFMETATVGIAASLGNDLYTTDDNWTSWKKLPTPLDEGLMKLRPYSTGERVTACALWKDWILARQRGQVYYSPRRGVHWRRLDDGTAAFTVDEATSELWSVTALGDVLRRTNPNTAAEKLVSFPSVAKAAHLVARAGALYFATDEGIVGRAWPRPVATGFYTTDYPIDTPYIVVEKNGIRWGGDFDHLYRDTGKGWTREAVFPFWVEELSVEDNGSVRLWDGVNTYRFDPKTKTHTTVHPVEPLKDFLHAPIGRVSVRLGSRGCFHGYEKVYHFRRAGANAFIPESGSLGMGSATSFTHAQLEAVLRRLNNDPEYSPSIADFGITAAERKRYGSLSEDEMVGEALPHEGLTAAHFREALRGLDTTTSQTVRAATAPERVHATTTNWAVFALYNSAGDSVVCRTEFFDDKPWGLPYKVSYKGARFTSRDPTLPLLIGPLLPKNAPHRQIYSNETLMRALAWLRARADYGSEDD